MLRLLWTGDIDEGPDERVEREYAQSPRAIARNMLGGRVSLPWTLAATMGIEVWLTFTRLTLGGTGDDGRCRPDRLAGPNCCVTATAETARPVR